MVRLGAALHPTYDAALVWLGWLQAVRAMTRHAIEAVLRTLAALPDDDFEPYHFDELAAAQSVARDEVRRMDQREANKAAADAQRARERSQRPKQKVGGRKPDPPELKAARAVVLARSGGICEHPDGCGDRATHVHHKAGRVGRGVHEPSMLLHLCDPHHRHVHANPEQSYANGSMVSRHGGRAVVVDTKGS